MVVLAWIVAAGIGNVAVPQLERVAAEHSGPFIPTDAESNAAVTRAAKLFGEPTSNNLNYVVLKRDQPLQPQDRHYYDRLVASLRADTDHVVSVTDLWADPLTAPLAQSRDGQVTAVMVQLSGVLGTPTASEAVNTARETVSRLDPPTGLHVYVTGPGSTLVDEFAAVDHQMLVITAATVAVILVLLLVVYRSLVAAAIPLISVGLALAVARPLVAALGEGGLVEVSLFTVALIAAMILGAGTDYAIFVMGRYHERRRRGIDPMVAMTEAYSGVAPVIIGSGLTIATALACLNLAKLSMFRSIGLPCALGVLVGMLAALTLTPALMSLAVRHGHLEPRRSILTGRWRRFGVVVARWPGPILVVSGGLIILLAMPLAGLRTGWNEPAAAPPDVESSHGYAAMEKHFPENQLFPNVVTIEADHDLRNPAGLIAIERITRQLMAVEGVRLVQSVTRPAGKVPDEATVTYQSGVLGTLLDDHIHSLTQRLARVGDLEADLSRVNYSLEQLGRGMEGSVAGLREVGSAADDMRAGMDGLQRNITTVSGYLDPLRRFVDNTPDCPANPICSVVSRVVEPVDGITHSSTELSNGATKLTGGSTTALTALAGMPQTVSSMRDALSQAQSASHELRVVVDAMFPQLLELSDYLRQVDTDFRASAAGGFYLPARALSDPTYQKVLRALVSPNGRATRLLVFGRGPEWGADGAQRARQIQTAVAEATKEGTLTPLSVELTGVGPATRDLQGLVNGDIVLLVGATLALIWLIVAIMLRSPVAGVAVVGTVLVSYASALGVSVFIWQHLLGQPLHWAVAPMAFMALVGVGTDYNLLLAMRIREEARAGLNTGLVRAFAGTGGVVTTAGIVFGITMFALVVSTVLSVAQIGLTIGIGLLLDTLIVRTLLLPSIVVLLGRWFWWPSGDALGRPDRRRRWTMARFGRKGLGTPK